MRIAILGIRGIPARYGGFETFAEELAPRLVARGHDVTVYGRSNSVDRSITEFQGVRVVVLPTLPGKYTDTPVHTIFACLHAMFQHYDAVLACNAANAPFLLLLRLAGIPVVLNVDGIERMRRKWGLAGQAWYRLGEYFATKVPSALVSNARVIQEYYESQWGVDSTMIPYGADIERPTSVDELLRWGLRPQEYVLVVTRLEPENNADFVIRAFREVSTSMRLVIVGDAPYAAEYRKMVLNLAAEDDRVLMTGFVYGVGYRELQANAYCFVQATEVGGTHPALIEGMWLCGAVVANGTPENREVLAMAGDCYEPGQIESLREILQNLLNDPERACGLRQLARQRVETQYSWSVVSEAYDDLLSSMARRSYNPVTRE